MTKGKLVFRLHGQKLAGLWELVRIAKEGDKQDPWMLFKKRDAWARSRADYDVVAALPDSVFEKPLGLAEKREPRGSVAPAGPPAELEPDLSAAVKAALPRAVEPQLATLAATPPTGSGWVVDAKYECAPASRCVWPPRESDSMCCASPRRLLRFRIRQRCRIPVAPPPGVAFDVSFGAPPLSPNSRTERVRIGRKREVLSQLFGGPTGAAHPL
jgi:hypothetical protein